MWWHGGVGRFRLGLVNSVGLYIYIYAFIKRERTIMMSLQSSDIGVYIYILAYICIYIH